MLSINIDKISIIKQVKLNKTDVNFIQMYIKYKTTTTKKTFVGN